MLNTTQFGCDANYRTVVRVFPDVVEIITKPINHGLELARSESFGMRRPSRKIDLPDDERALKDEENKVRAVRRSKQSLRWHVQRMQADHMLTLTYRENMLDIERLKSDFDKFRRLVQARYPEWNYIAAREKQERGAFHLHVAVGGFQDINYLRTCWYKVLGCVGATGDAVLGQVNIRSQWGSKSRSKWSASRLANYLSKYITKDFDLHEHASKRYWVSRGVPREVITKYWLKSEDYTQMILDVLDVAMVHGAGSFPYCRASHEKGLLYLSVDRRYKTLSSTSYNDALCSEL